MLSIMINEYTVHQGRACPVCGKPMTKPKDQVFMSKAGDVAGVAVCKKCATDLNATLSSPLYDVGEDGVTLRKSSTPTPPTPPTPPVAAVPTRKQVTPPVVPDDIQERMNERIKYELYMLLLERGLR
jgi:hypothetical protein